MKNSVKKKKKKRRFNWRAPLNKLKFDQGLQTPLRDRMPCIYLEREPINSAGIIQCFLTLTLFPARFHWQLLMFFSHKSLKREKRWEEDESCALPVCRLTNELFLVGSFNSGEHMSCVLIKHQTDSLCIDYAAGRDGRVCKMFMELFVVSLWSFKAFSL